MKSLRYNIIKVTDPKKLKEPVALLVEWTPISTVGSPKGHSIKEIEDERFEIMPSLGFKASGIIVGLILLAFDGILIYNFIQKPNGPVLQLGMLGFFLVVTTILFVISIKELKEHVFDKTTGYYWTRRYLNKWLRRNSVSHGRSMKDIVAFQLLKGQGSDRVNFYELNIITIDGKRTKLFCLENYTSLLMDARDLAYFAEVPLWDATEMEQEEKTD